MPFAGAVLTLLAAAAAQAPLPAEASLAEADVAIFANVRARELRFDEKPRVEVRVYGSVNGRPAATVDRTDRTNLPDEVQPHVTYRDTGVLLTITSTLPDIEAILDEALAAPAEEEGEP
jgi:hypothetical protein